MTHPVSSSFPSRLVAWLGIDRAGLMQALRLASAAWIAFAIATLAGIPHAYWAAMPIWVVVQPTRGLLIERAIFRLVGTIIGAAVGLALLKFVAAPVPVLLLLGLWVGLASAGVHLVRGVQSYGVMLAGMTAGVVVLPTVLAPDGSIDLAVARVACTLIGVVVVTLVMAVSTPLARRVAFYDELVGLAAAAVRLSARRVSGVAAGTETRSLMTSLAAALGGAAHVTAGSLDGYRRAGGINALALSAFALLAETETLLARAESGRAVLPDAADLERLAASIDGEGAAARPSSDDAATALGRIAAADAPFAASLGALVEAARLLKAAPAATSTPSLDLRHLLLSPYRERGLAIESGLVAGLATAVAGLAGLFSGLHQGELAALGVCIFASVMTSLPAPRLAAPKMLVGVSVGLVVALFYRFAIQPSIDSVPLLLLSLVPFLLVGGLARVSRRTAIPALDANMCFLLASQPVLPVAWSVGGILADAAALIVGAAFVVGLFLLLPDRVALEGRRLRNAIRRDLARLALSAEPGPAGDVRTERQIARLGFHLVRAGGRSDPGPEALIGAMRLGEAIIRLKQIAATGTEGAAAERAIAAVAFAESPASAIATLGPLAASSSDSRAAGFMRDAADALAAGGPLAAGFAAAPAKRN